MKCTHETAPWHPGVLALHRIVLGTARALLLLGPLLGPLLGQAQFAELGKRALPPGTDLTYTIVHGDLDGDGDTDVVVGARDRLRFYRNEGDGRFTDTTASTLPAIWDATGLGVADVDGDGDLDLAVAHSGGRLHLLRNGGNGNFTDASANLPQFLYPIGNALVFADVDGDGDDDLVVACLGLSLLLANNGAGVFTDVTAAQLPPLFQSARAVAAGDLDGDGDVDLVLGGGPYPSLPLPHSPTIVLRNLGGGTFQDSSATSLPANSGVATAVALADVDGDGDLDLAVGKEGLPRQLYRNLGNGTFLDVSATNLPGIGALDFTNALVFGDVDRDGDLDLVCGNDDPVLGGRQNRLFTNDGAGAFTDATALRLPIDNEPTKALALGDVDGDLDLDLLVGNRFGNRLEQNDGAGRFYDVTASELPTAAGPTSALALGDVDGDGDQDLILAGRSRLFRNDGTGTFADATAQLPPLPQPSTTVVLGDVDGDGDLDALFGSFAGPDHNRLLQNDGTGLFTDVTAGRLPTSSAQTNALALGDVDGDGDLDLLCGDGNAFVGAQSRLYRNDGTGTFTDDTTGHLPTATLETTALELVDIDGDGDLDLVLTNGITRADQNRLYRNDGTGTFTDVTATTLPLANTYTDAIAVGDVDGDGDRDLVLAGSLPFQTRLLRQDGASGFTDVTTTQLPPIHDSSASVTLVDVDLDGDLDLVFGALDLNGGHLCENDGSGTFTDVTAARGPGLNSPGVAVVGDVDADLDPDLLIAGDNPARLYRNLHRQIDAPFVLHVGRTWQLDAFLGNLPANQVAVVLPFFSTTRIRVPLPPYGTLGIDPNQMVPLPPFLVMQPAGRSTLLLTIPNVPALAGLVISVQALLDSAPRGLHLSNVLSEVLVR